MEFEKLEHKIEQFYRKYYFKKFFLNLFTSTAGLALFLLTISGLAYFVGFEMWERKMIFVLWTSGAVVLLFFVLIPLLRIFRVFERLGYDKLTNLLNRYFPLLQDKLINVVELKRVYQDSPNDLVRASLEQKSSEILPLPILQVPALAFPLRQFLFMLASLSVFSVLLLAFPNFYERGALPIIDYGREVKLLAPYDVTLINEELKVKRGNDFELKVKVSGDYLPDELKVHFGGNQFYMRQVAKNEFSYQFKKVNSSFDFYLTGFRYESGRFKLEALPVPTIFRMDAELVYPPHTGLATQRISDKGDFNLPEGTTVHWNVHVGNTDSLLFQVDSLKESVVPTDGIASYKKRFLKSASYSLQPKNAYFSSDSGMFYKVTVRADEYPEIKVNQLPDSTQLGLFYFNGLISDDYGFRSLKFWLEYDSAGVKQKRSFALPLNRNLSENEFFHQFDFKSIGLKGESLKYYFSITDNDGVNGGKTAYSQFFSFFMPTQEDLERISNEQREANVKDMEESLKLAKDLKKDIENLKQALKTDKLTNYQKQEMVKGIKQKQEQLQNMLQEQIKNENDLINMKENFGNEKMNELLEKQKMINELAEQLLDDELKELLNELEKMQNEGNDKELEKLSEKLDMSYEDMEKQLDRNLEMLKRFQVEEKLSGLQYEMENLADQQENLAEAEIQKGEATKKQKKAEKSGDKGGKNAKEKPEKMSKEELAERQKNIKEELERIKKEYEKTLKKNSELKQPMNMDSLKQEFKDAQQEQQDVEQKMQKSGRKKSSKSQKKASEKMQKIAKQMQQMLQQMQQMGMDVNEEEMRQLLDNLVWYSLEQEKLMNMLGGLAFKDPRYKEFTVSQKRLHDNFSIMKDSLYSLAERSMQIKKPIFDQLKELEYQQRVIEGYFQDRKQNEIMRAQQRVTTAANELALLFDEVLDQMQNMSGQGGGNPKKNQKKKGAKGQMPSIRKQQEQLKKQLQEMMQQMKNGKLSQKQMNKKLAKMFGKQETLRSKIQELMQKGKLSPKEQRLLNEINKLSEEVERDLINKRISPDLIQRKQKILTRMLEAERSMNEREKEKKREAKENKKKFVRPDKMFEQEKMKKNSFPTLLRKQNMELSPYYKDVYKNYLKELEKDGD